MPNPMTPNIATALPNLGFGGMSRPEPTFFQQGGGFQQFGQGLRQMTRPLAAGFAKDPNYRAAAQQQIATEQQMQQEQAAQIRQAVLNASLDSLGQLAESMKGVGSDKITGSPSTMQMIERSANNAAKAMIASGFPEEDAMQLAEQYKWRILQSADIQQPNELDQKIATTEKALGRKLSETEITKMAGAYVEPTQGEKPIFQDIIGEGGVKIPGVSYDNGRTFQPMTTDKMFGGGQFKGGFEDAVQFVLGQEGGYVEDDAKKGPTNMGINAQSNMPALEELGVADVKDLTTEQAVQIYKNNYWDALNLDSLPPSSQIVAFDAAVNQGPDFAAALIRGAGGDPQKMIELRRQAYEKLAESPEYSKYLPTWNKRLDDLSGIIGGGGLDVSKYATPEKTEPLQTKQIYDPSSPTGIRIVTEEQAVGQPGVPPAQAAAMENKEDQDFKAKIIATQQFEAQAERIKKKLVVGTKVGAVADVGQALSGLSAQAQMLGGMFGADTSILDPAAYGEDLNKTGAAQSAALQSDIVGLAYSLALAQNGARVTDQDVKRALQQIGASGMLSDPAQISAALDSAVEAMYLNLEIEGSVRGKDVPKHKTVSSEDTDIPEVKNDADYTALKSGTKFKDPEGNIRVKP